ncbi:MAG: hypothetical protein K6G85_11190 [Eubacterium sp.]|nr:hypothetical protein [Eubacterium sp.]
MKKRKEHILKELDSLDSSERMIVFKDFLSEDDKDQLNKIHKKQNELREQLAIIEAEEKVK